MLFLMSCVRPRFVFFFFFKMRRGGWHEPRAYHEPFRVVSVCFRVIVWMSLWQPGKSVSQSFEGHHSRALLCG